MHPLKLRRKALKMTQKELAALVNLDHTMISRIENEERRMTTHELQRFARALRCQEQDLLPPQEDWAYSCVEEHQSA